VSRVAVATRLGFREQARRPLLLVLLVGLPFFFITRAIAQTEQLPRSIGLPGGGEVLTNMRDIHGADMAAITVGFLAGLWACSSYSPHARPIAGSAPATHRWPTRRSGRALRQWASGDSQTCTTTVERPLKSAAAVAMLFRAGSEPS
jgi:hypothetical protein